MPAHKPHPTARPAPASRAGAVSVLRHTADWSAFLVPRRPPSSLPVSVAKQPEGLENTAGWILLTAYLQVLARCGQVAEMLVRFGRRSGQARESKGALEWPILARGLFLALRDVVRGEGAKLSLQLLF